VALIEFLIEVQFTRDSDTMVTVHNITKRASHSDQLWRLRLRVNWVN